MSVTVHFKVTAADKITSLEYQIGAGIPKLGDHIMNPFNADRAALVSELTGDGERQPFSVLCAEYSSVATKKNLHFTRELSRT